MRYIRRPAVLALICALLPASAQGQAGKRLDSNSPAGVEYQLPLEQARQNATDGGRDKPKRDGTAARPGTVPLFGAGIVARKRGDENAGGGRQGDGGSGAGSRASGSNGGDSGGGSGAPGDPAISRSTVGAAGSDDGSATLRTAGIALAVLLAGGLLGLGLRRGLRHTGD